MTNILTSNIAYAAFAKSVSSPCKQEKSSFIGSAMSEFNSLMENISAKNNGASVSVTNAQVIISKGTAAPGSVSALQAELDASVGQPVYSSETLMTISGDFELSKKVDGRVETETEPFVFNAYEGIPGQQDVNDSFVVETLGANADSTDTLLPPPVSPLSSPKPTGIGELSDLMVPNALKMNADKA